MVIKNAYFFRIVVTRTNSNDRTGLAQWFITFSSGSGLDVAGSIISDVSTINGVSFDTLVSNIDANTAKISYPEADSKKVGFISVSQAVDLDTMESNITTNTAYRNVGHLPLTGGTLTGALDINIGGRSGTHGVNKGLYATAIIGEYSDGFEFRHSNGTQGVGIGFAGIYAVGSATNQNLHIKAKGTGTTILWSNLTMQNHNITGVDKINNYSLYSFNEAINLNTEKISYPAADSKKVGLISVTQAVDLDTMESNIATNNAKISYPAADSKKVGLISVSQPVNLDTMESNIATNNAKVSASGSISTHSDVALVNPQLNDILIYSTISQDWGNGSF